MNQIAELRKAHGYSQAFLGELLGVAQNTISNWEQGKREPDYASLKELAFHLDCSVDYLIGGSSKILPETFASSASRSNQMPPVAQRIKQRRQELGISLQELSEWTEISRSTLQRYENGKIPYIRPQSLGTLARALATSPDWLYGWIDDVERKSPIDAYLEDLLRDLGFNLLVYRDGNAINLGGPISLEEYQRFKDDISSYITFQADKLAKFASKRENEKIQEQIKSFQEQKKQAGKTNN